MRLEIEITQSGAKLPVMVIENLKGKEVLPVIKNIVNGVVKDKTLENLEG